jgi:RNA polymerase sigma factor (sigma-70 family)
MPISIRVISDERAAWLAQNALPYEGRLRGWLSSRCLPGLEPDDVVQETYARLIQAKNLTAVRNPKAYMFQTAWSVIVTHARRERVVAMETFADFDQLGLEAETPGPEELAAERDELLQLGEALATLPGKIGDVLRLRRVQGLSQKQVASKLGLAESTVEKHMHRGFLLLLKYFSERGYRVAQTGAASEGAGIQRRPRTLHPLPKVAVSVR